MPPNIASSRREEPRVRVHLAAAEELMKQLCLGDARHELGQIAWEHIATGGKRLRARLAVSGLRALGGPAEDGVAWGAACELLHNASLIHDDIQDGDRYRRGNPALWVRHGAPQAINAGDLCITLGYAAIGSIPVSDALRWQLTSVVARASRRIVEGQAAEMSLLTCGVPGWADYASCVEGKTSALFSMPVEGAALIAGRPPEEAACLSDACRPVGLLFQIQDDILDLYGDSGRDMTGSDIAHPGKATALVIEHLRLHPRDRDWLLQTLTAPRAETPRERIEEVIARFAAGGALAAAWQRIDQIRRGLSGSRGLSAEPVLHDLIDHFIGDVLRPIAHTRA
jgi:geranylgeranyl diphosphate synthase type I